MSADHVVRFGPFEADLRLGEVRKHGIRLRLHGHPIQVLGVLLERPGEPVSREELRARLWGTDTFVDFEHGLNAAVNKLRSALSDSADSPRFIETIPRHGYRFIGAIDPSVDSAPATPVDSAPVTAAVRQSRMSRPVLQVLVAVTFLAAIGAGVWWWRSTPARSAEAPARVMLAVLPFENFSKDPGPEYFSDGLTEELISELGGLNPERLGVIARTSVMGYRRTTKTVRDISRELGVDYVIEGSVRRDGARVRISAQLIRASDETHVWARSYDRSLDAVLPLQSEIARVITGEIHGELPGGGRGTLAAAKPVGWPAHEAALKGQYFLERRTPDAILAAREHFERAIALDPGYALAHVGLADSHILAISYANAPAPESMSRARAAVDRALQLDENLAAGYAYRGVILAEHDWDWPGAERSFRRAIELNPNFAYARKLYAEYLSYVGRFEEAIAEARLARQHDPLSIVTNSLVGLVLYRARQYDAAVDTLRRTVEMDPDHPMPYLPLGLALSMLKRHGEAIAALEKGLQASDGNPEMLAQVALAYGRAGRPERARLILRELHDRSRSQQISPFCFALVHAGLEESQETIEWLEKAYRQRDWLLTVLKTEPTFDSVRTDPRFQNLLGRLNLPS
jgi:TolB-like protein/DNA-binding winged helix-turn-helix (wHTH) protein/Tfp pilus assembly protein PilF